MIESANQGSRKTENLVSYSGIEEYVPVHKVVDQRNDAGCLATATPPEWETVASFQVELQIRQDNDRPKHHPENHPEHRLLVRNLHTGTIETWSELETEQVQQWMTEQTCPKLPLASVQIQQVQILQSPQPGIVTTVGDRSLQSICANQPFMLKIFSQFTELPQELNEGSIACQIQCNARNLATGAILNLQDISVEFHITPDTEAEIYQSQLPQMILPEPGVYRLSVALSVLELSDLSTLFRPAALQVI